MTTKKETIKNYCDLWNYLPLGVVIYEAYRGGQDFIIIDGNKTFEKIDNIKIKDIKGKKVTKVFPGVKEMGLFDVFKKVYKTGKKEHFRASFYQDEKLQGWRENYVYKEKEGTIVAIFSDETKNKQIEENLRKSEERYELALKGTSDGIWDWDIIKNKVYYSDKWKEMIGYKPNEIKNDFSEWQKRLHPEDVKRSVKYVQNYISSGGKENFEIEFRMQHKKGHYVPILAKAFMLTTKDKKPVRMVGTHTDLSRQKEAEEKYKNIFELSPEIIFVINSKGEVEESNRRLFDWLGFDKEKVIGVSLKKLPFLDENAQKTIFSKFKARMRKEDLPPYDLEFITKNGEIKIGRIFANLISHKDEKKDLVIISDVTKEIEAKKETEEKIVELEKINKLMIGRELKMIELKEQIKELKNESQTKK